MRVSILSAEVFSRRVKSKKTGQEYLFRDQMGVFVAHDGTRTPFTVALDEHAQAFAVGDYEILDTSFYIDRDNKLSVGKLQLRPLAKGSETPQSRSSAPPAARMAGG